MARTGVRDVRNSPAVPLICEREAAGLDLSVVNNRLRVSPASKLTPEFVRRIHHHRESLKALVLICDAGTQARRALFARQWTAAPTNRIPAFLVCPDLPYERGRCFSCADRLDRPRLGRCWRCALAWRLACRLPMPAAELAHVYDETKVVASMTGEPRAASRDHVYRTRWQGDSRQAVAPKVAPS